MRRRLADPMFADLEVDRVQIEEWLAAAPAGAEAFARAFDRVGAASGFGLDPFAELRAEIERWRNHFADLDSDAEALSDELRLSRRPSAARATVLARRTRWSGSSRSKWRPSRASALISASTSSVLSASNLARSSS